MRRRSGNAEMRAMLEEAGWKRLSASGSETWVDPHNRTLHTLAAAVELERERRLSRVRA